MVGISGTSKTGEMHYYYACQKHRLEHACEKKAIRRDVIENAVARAIMMYCLDDETIDFIVDSTIAYFKQKDHELHIEAMENELAAVQQAISNLMKAIEAGIITPTTRTRLLDLEEQQSKLSAKINTAKAERVEINRDDLIAGLQLFRTGDIKNKKFLAKLFNTFLIAVYLYDDNRLKIVFSFTGNHNSVEIPLELDNDCPDSEIVSDETEVRMSHLECRKNLGSSPSSGEAEKDDDCSDGRFVRTAPLPPQYSHLYMAASGQLVGVICIADPLRPEAAHVLRQLRKLGISNTVMMTGDSDRTAAAIAKQVGVNQYFAEVLPEDKASFVQKAKAEGHTVVMIGDGINDSPALSAADIGIAIHSGAAIAREIADVTIKADSLEELVALKAIANQLQRRVSANYRFVLSFNSTLIVLGAMGILQPATSAMLHNLSTIGISLKSMTNLLQEESVPQLNA